MAALNRNDWVEGEGTTVNLVTVDLVTYAVPAGSTIYLYARLVLRIGATGVGGGLRLQAIASRNGAAAPTIDATQLTTILPASLTGATATIVASGNNIILRGTGIAVTTISWLTRCEPKTYTP